MDTLGRIAPNFNGLIEKSHLIESLERVKYLVEGKNTGILCAPSGSAIRGFLNELLATLTADGLSANEIRLSGMTAEELPQRLAAELGLMIPPCARSIESWTVIQNFAQSARLVASRNVLIFTGLELVDPDLIPSLDRALAMFRGAVPCLFACWQPVSGALKTVLQEHTWLRVELSRLTSRESLQHFSQALSKCDSKLKLSADAGRTIFALTQGETDKLTRLAELAALAAEAEELMQIDAQTIEALQSELKGGW